MKRVGAALGDERNLPPGHVALISALARDRGTELLNRIQRNRQNGVESVLAPRFVVDIGSVQKSRCFDPALALRATWPDDATPGLSAQQRHYTLRVCKRKLINLRFGERVSNGRILRIHRRRLRVDVDYVRGLANRQLQIESFRHIDLQQDLRSLGGKAGFLDLLPYTSRGQLEGTYKRRHHRKLLCARRMCRYW